MVKIHTTLDNFRFAAQFAEMFSGYEVVIDENGIIRPDIDYCPKCDSPTQYNGYNKMDNKITNIFGLATKKGKIVCSNPDCDFQYSVPQACFLEWTETVGDWLGRCILSLRSAKLSPKVISDHLEEVYGAIYSSEYIRLRVKQLTDGKDRPHPSKEPSRVIVHDEQFVKIKGVDLKRISCVDANNENVYYDQLHANRTEDTQIRACREVKKEVGSAYAGVFDDLDSAKNAYREEFGHDFKIQNCLFHFAQNIRDAYKEEVGYGKGRACIPLDHLIGFFQIINSFFDHDREHNELRRLQTERNEHVERVNKLNTSDEKKREYIEDYHKNYDWKAREYLSQVRKARRRKNGIKLTLRTEEQAKELFEKAKLYNVFPRKVQKQVKRLEKDWTNFTHCLRDEKIPPTTNKIEQYYATTLNWVEKNNLQSEEDFYKQQKFNLIRRYGIPLFEKGTFTKLISMTALLIIFLHPP